MALFAVIYIQTLRREISDIWLFIKQIFSEKKVKHAECSFVCFTEVIACGCKTICCHNVTDQRSSLLLLLKTLLYTLQESSGGEDNEDQENQEPAESQGEPATKKAKTNKLGSKKAKKTNAK